MKPEKMNIHQQATFHYLQEIKRYCLQNIDIKQFPNKKEYKQLAKILNKVSKISSDFNKEFNYADLYFKYHNAIEKVADLELNSRERKTATYLDGLFIRTFENQNKIHDFLFDNVINEGEIESKNNLQKNLIKKTDGLSKKDIRHPDNPLNAFFASMLGGFGYNPLKRNNVPYLPFSENRLPTHRTCLRIGAQTRDSGYVNSTFQRYLLANARNRVDVAPQNPQGQYDYVYISLMKTEESRQDVKKEGIAKKLDQFVRNSEGTRAAALECINLAKDYRAAVITLPADGGFFLDGFSMKKGAAISNHKINMKDLANQLIESIKLDRNDFSMSKDVKKALFGEPFNERLIETLLKSAINEVIPDVKGKDLSDINLTPEKRNAVLFQFVKWNLSNYILEVLNPRAYNMSCKDAIDRGGIHTLWYHMNLLAKHGTPLTKEEFFKFLDSPAMVVKYRALNDNRNLLVNVMKHRLDADATFEAQHPWARKWVEMNSPKQEVKPSVELSKLKKMLNVEKAAPKEIISEQQLKQALTNIFNQQVQSCAKQQQKSFSYADSANLRVPVMVRC
ncbi:hypothetical protein [Candidatus Berkiella aquae]|uniref:Uncharacterized protein n=1 Tax=Candidatus Berkiella aquae TaxID=295108 RepID=A0A0Q9YLK6_9GAMM|nr:hypothetical protein [Candidatus Berkiella aquae]MCS5711535.1 hypothetical protein [Candidatus Berkiella aquae]